MSDRHPARPRHLFVTTGYPPKRGIFHHRSLLSLRKFVDSRVLLLTTRPTRRHSYNIDGIQVIKIFCPITGGVINRPFLFKAAALSVWPLVKAEMFRADLCEAGNLFPSGFMLALWSKSIAGSSKPLISNVIGSDFNLFIRKLQRKYDRFVRDCIRFQDVLLCRSKDLVDHTSRLIDSAKPMVKWVPTGVDTGIFAPEGAAENVFHPSSSTIRFLYLGGFACSELNGDTSRDVKGGLLLLEGWRYLESKIQNARLVIAGPGTRSALLAPWLQTLMYPERVSIIENEVAAEEIASLMRGCDCLVIPSRNEGLPNVLLEAQACGMGVVASDAGGITDVVEPNVTARLFPSENVDALTRELAWCAVHRDQVKEMGIAGRQHIVRDFTWERFVERVLPAYDLAWRNKYNIPFPRKGGE